MNYKMSDLQSTKSLLTILGLGYASVGIYGFSKRQIDIIKEFNEKVKNSFKKEVEILNEEFDKENLTKEQKIDRFNKTKIKIYEKAIKADSIKEYLRETSNNVFDSAIWPILSITSMPMGIIFSVQNDWINKCMIKLLKNS